MLLTHNIAQSVDIIDLNKECNVIPLIFESYPYDYPFIAVLFVCKILILYVHRTTCSQHLTFDKEAPTLLSLDIL